MATPFTTHQAGDGVWGAVSPPLQMPAISNAAIIDLGDRTVVVDSFMTDEAAEALVDAARQLTGRRPDLLVTTHHHGDHVGGNAVFTAIPRIGTSRMRELIAGEVPLPDVLIDGPIEVVGSQRRITVVPVGRGHTESDIIVNVGDVGVVVAGDLIWNEMHPKTSDGYPGDWVQSLETLGSLNPRAVIGGHGELGGSELIDGMIEYMTALGEMVDAVASKSLTAPLATPPAGTENWRDVQRFRDGLEAIAGRA